MKTIFIFLIACLGAIAQGSMLKISANSATRKQPGEVEADYTTSHVFVDELAGDAVPLTVFFDPQMLGVQTCEVFTNLNRRDRAALDADGDGIHDGIKPPPGTLIAAGSDAHYFKAYTMNLVSGGYQLTLNATTTGAYRLTVRWRLNSDPAGTYRYYNDEPSGSNNKRDHCIVVSPKTIRDMVMYELNTLNVEAESATQSGRSTFVDLWDGPGSTRTPRWNLDYARELGVNWLWFQPVHPLGIDGRHLSAADINNRNVSLGFPNPNATTWLWNGGSPGEDVNYAYTFGSPYAVKNFFEIEPRMSKANTRVAALQEFQDFVSAADNGGANTVNVMLDAPFNHTSFDVELGAKGVTYFSGAANATDEIRSKEARFFSRSGNYAMRAFSAGSIALAPDRGDFGKFIDTYDVYWGRYAALVAANPADNGNRLNEGDWFDYSIGAEGSSGSGNGHFDVTTRNVWRYFTDYCLHWLDQTGCTAGTSAADQAWKGIDGLRADFGQGLPPQAWEYIVNVTRARKWTFAFMAESLDGGAVTYRSARHFDILNENILFAMKGLSVGSNSMTSDFRNLLEQRRTDYGQALVLLNTTSHDEQNYNDPWQALLRYPVCATIDGVPMIFTGQEQGLSDFYGYDLMEKNFGKYIPHFKTWNSMMPLWTNGDFGLDQLYPVYAAIDRARHASPALRSSNRYFLDQPGGGTHQRIFSVAKYENANASPATSDVVFAFVNLDRDSNQSGTFNVNISNGSNLFGIKSARNYNVRNLSAYTTQDPTRSTTLLWGAGRAGSDVLANGVSTALNKVPVTNGAWTTAPYEAQFLKLLDTTAPVATPMQPFGGEPFGYALGDSVMFMWPAVAPDAEGVTPFYRVNVSIDGGPVTSFITNFPWYTVTAGENHTVSITVQAVNPNDPTQAGPASLASATIHLLNATADNDADGQSNGAESTAGTNPFADASVFRVLDVQRPAASQTALIWSSVTGKQYEVLAASSADGTYNVISGAQPIPSAGSNTSFTDSSAGGVAKFYKVRVVP